MKYIISETDHNDKNGFHIYGGIELPPHMVKYALNWIGSHGPSNVFDADGNVVMNGSELQQKLENAI